MSNSPQRAPVAPIDVSALLAEVTLLAKESAPDYLRSDERADLAQDVAFECWRMMSRKTWHPPRSLRAFVSRIVRLRATDQLRRQFSDQESLRQLEGRYAPGAIIGFDPGTITRDCYEQTAQAAQAVPRAKFSRTDVDGIIGGGLAFDVGGRSMTVSVRYDVGFVKLVTYSDSKNRVLSFLCTLESPINK